MSEYNKAIRRSVENIWRGLQHAAIRESLDPVKIRKSGRVTVVFWQDGTATSVKCSMDQKYDSYTAFCAALAKKVFGSSNALKRIIENCPVEVEHPVLLNDDGTPASIKCSDVRMSEAESVAVGPMKAKCYTFTCMDVKDLD